MSRTFYTADLHLGHANIIKYCNRPFRNVEHMNDTLVHNWNSIVKPEDTVIHNGDFSFKNNGVINADHWIKRLNGRIVFIHGNHDKGNSLKTSIEKLYIRYGGVDVCIVHHPKDYDINMKYNFVGHVHNNWKFQNVGIFVPEVYLINIGVDCWDFKPVTFEEIMKGLKKWQLGRDELFRKKK